MTIYVLIDRRGSYEEYPLGYFSTREKAEAAIGGNDGIAVDEAELDALDGLNFAPVWHAYHPADKFAVSPVERTNFCEPHRPGEVTVRRVGPGNLFKATADTREMAESAAREAYETWVREDMKEGSR